MDVQTLVSRASSLVMSGDYAGAIACCDRALAADPDSADALFQRGSARAGLGSFALAAADMETALSLDPDLKLGADTELYTALFAAHWEGFEDKVAAVRRRIEAGHVVRPFSALLLPLTPREQSQAAIAYARDLNLADAEPLEPYRTHAKIRLGYISADFRDHATSHLVNGMFEAHDRSKFEVVAFSLDGPDDPVRALIAGVVDRYVDASAMINADVVRIVRDMEIDIAVDMNATLHRQPQFFARRIAPVQVNYLGYPGTSGHPAYDYIIGDSFVTPPEHAAHYTEKLVLMPHCYQVNSLRRYGGSPAPSRADLGLPLSGFVFAAFNASHKITPDVFDVWMKLLRAVEGSVLWLLATNVDATSNLRREAGERGVDPARLVFAPRLPLAAHLARHRAADLFLDTFHYGAHTTGSDALWSGLPIVTRLGAAFPARVSASLLAAAGLPELIARDAAEYEMIALDLARNPARLSALQARLDETRLTCPLFDTLRYTRDIERAYLQMMERCRSGLAPAAIKV